MRWAWACRSPFWAPPPARGGRRRRTGGIARQPEASGKIQTAMIIALALIESLVIYALLMFFILQGKLPGVMEVLGTGGAG